MPRSPDNTTRTAESNPAEIANTVMREMRLAESGLAQFYLNSTPVLLELVPLL